MDPSLEMVGAAKEPAPDADAPPPPPPFSVEFSDELLEKLKEGKLKDVVPKLNNIQVTGNIHPMLLMRGENFLRRALSNRGEGAALDVEELVAAFETASSTWLGTGAFKRCAVAVAQTAGGSEAVPAVSIDITVDGAKQSREFGIFTTETVMPELKVGVRNALRGLVNFEANYIPPAAKTRAYSGSLVFNAVPIGSRGEFIGGIRREDRPLHVASEERIEEARWTLEGGAPGGMLQHVATIAYERRQLAAADAGKLPSMLTRDFKQHAKLYLRHRMHWRNVSIHSDPLLNTIYPLPIGGVDAMLTSEVALRALDSPNNFLKSELQVVKHTLLTPFVSLDLGLRLGGVVPLDSQSRVPLNDRLLLSWRHVRGYRNIGPSTLDCKTPSSTPLRYGAIGGNAVWAASASLNLPLLPFPDNGMASMHLFANAGNLCQFDSMQDVQKRWRDMFSQLRASIGAGLVITRVPLLGPLPNGRLEVNASVPINFDSEGGLTFAAPNKHLFDRFKFGIVWSSALAM